MKRSGGLISPIAISFSYYKESDLNSPFGKVKSWTHSTIKRLNLSHCRHGHLHPDTRI